MGSVCGGGVTTAAEEAKEGEDNCIGHSCWRALCREWCKQQTVVLSLFPFGGSACSLLIVGVLHNTAVTHT